MFLVSPSVILRPSSLMETTLKETALRSHKKSYSQCLMTQRSKTVTTTVRNIPKFKDRANWSCDTFQPMRGRACVYQQTNQNIAPVIKNFQNNGRSRTESVIVLTLRHILKTFHEAYTIFLSGQRIGSHIGSVS